MKMKPEINELIEISKYYGKNKEYVIAGGGNTSFKASGKALAEMNEEGLVALNRERLHIISTGTYSDDSVAREEQVKEDLLRSIIGPVNNKRPSVETSLHEIIQYKFVVHLHPTIINGLLCSRNAKSLTQKLFGDIVLFVPYTDPGYTLFKKLESEILSYRTKFSHDPQIIFLENHGSFVGADTTEEIKKIYDDIIFKIREQVPPISDVSVLPYNPILNKVLPTIRILLSEEQPWIIRYRNNSLI